MNELAERLLTGPEKTEIELGEILRALRIRTSAMSAEKAPVLIDGTVLTRLAFNETRCAHCGKTIRISTTEETPMRSGFSSTTEIVGVLPGSIFIDAYSGLCKEHAREEILQPYLEKRPLPPRKKD